MSQGEQIDVVSTINIPPLVILGTVESYQKWSSQSQCKKRTASWANIIRRKEKLLNMKLKKENEE